LSEISNGCALGGSMAEALLYGLLETVERDAFLMAWYGRLPVPRIDPGTARDRTIPLRVAAINEETGYWVELYETTMKHGIPGARAMGKRQDGGPGRPRMRGPSRAGEGRAQRAERARAAAGRAVRRPGRGAGPARLAVPCGA
jgi:ribosomal protein S12 methylthiotransferase accessory factor YcaO